MFKFRKLFPKDVIAPIVQRDLSTYLRVGQITSVDTVSGLCNLRWVDRPGIRRDVIITQPSVKTWHMPEVGNYVVVGFDHKEQARIVTYINTGQKTRVTTLKDLPLLREGEKLWEVGGSYIHMKINGDIILSTLTGGYILLESSTGSLKTEVINIRTVSEAGIQSHGLIRRFVLNADGTRSQQIILDNFGKALVEYNLKIVEHADLVLGVSDLSNPLIDITFGTLVDNEGKVIDKNNGTNVVTTSPKKEVCVRIKLKSGVQLDIDKAGCLSLTGVKLNINKGSVDVSDPDIIQGLEINNALKGSKGEHIAREHDKVTLPISTTYTDPEHTTLSTKALVNVSTLQQIAQAIIAPGLGPCSLNPILLTGQIEFQGEITEGARDLYAGDGDGT